MPWRRRRRSGPRVGAWRNGAPGRRGVGTWQRGERPYVVHVEKLEKIYDPGTPRETPALRGVNLDISLGEIVLVFGPSGSGKSTLLNILAALDMPTAGKIVVDKKDLARLTGAERIEHHQFKVGMVFQAYNLIPSLTVMQNITMPARLAGFTRGEYLARGDDLLRQFNLEEIRDRLATNISGGQQQRVGIMRALMNRPAMIIADEPTGNLDSVNSRIIMGVFKALNAETTTTMIIVSHDPSLFEIADRVVYMEDGKVAKQAILSPKAKVDESMMDVPIEYRLTPEKREELMRGLGAKPTPEEEKERARAGVEEPRKAWRAREEEMVAVKRAALERLKIRAREAAERHARRWAFEEREMETLKRLAFERVRVRRRAERERWKREDAAAEALRAAARERVLVRRRAAAATRERAWVLEEKEVEALKRLAMERIQERRAAWRREAREVDHVKRAAVKRVRARLVAESREGRRMVGRLRKMYGRGAARSPFARLLVQRDRLARADQYVLAALLVLLSRDQQDALSDAQLRRAFAAIRGRVEGAADYADLRTQLDRPEADGGVGLYRQTAEHVATGIEALLQLVRYDAP